MATVNAGHDGGTMFTIKPPTITLRGYSAAVDPSVEAHLADLDQLLGKNVCGKRNDKLDAIRKHVTDLLEPMLTARYVPAQELVPAQGGAAVKLSWAPRTLAATLESAAASELTLSDVIDLDPNLSPMRSWYSKLSSVDDNTRLVLEKYPNIQNYLLVFAVMHARVTDIPGLMNFITTRGRGVASVIGYAAVSAARTYVSDQKLMVAGYNDDGTPFESQIRGAKLSLTGPAFKPTLKKLVDEFIFNGAQIEALKKATIKFPADLTLPIIQLMKKAPITIDGTNIDYFLPQFITQLRGAPAADTASSDDPEVADQDFIVDPFEETGAAVQVSRSAVRCAAQLFYSMVLGDELDVFSTVNYFTHNYLLRGGIEIQDSTLRDDLQLYVFSNKFLDLKTKRINDRTRGPERAMFYKQVFDAGPDITDSDLSQVLVPNPEFPRLWKVLILETAKYIEQAQAAFYPDQYVPRQNVRQAVEDLQYNLSTHCIGMVNVVSPLIYAELNFVIRRIFMHEEVMRQIVPAGGTWWRVVETLYLGMRNKRPRSTVFNNRASLGYDILSRIANYDPTTFADNDKFSEFVGAVQAFITTQSILQQDNAADGDAANTAEHPHLPGIPGMGQASGNGNGLPRGIPMPVGAGAGSAAGSNGKSGSGEWDF